MTLARKSIIVDYKPDIFHILSMTLYMESAAFPAIAIPGNSKDGQRYIFVIPNMNN